MPDAPLLVSMLLCDHVWFDPRSEKWPLLGVHHDVVVPSLPHDHGELVIYVCLAGLRGGYRVTLEVVRIADDLVVARLDAPAPLVEEDPLRRVDFAFQLRRIHFVTHGRYAFRLLLAGRPVGEVVFSVLPPEVPS